MSKKQALEGPAQQSAQRSLQFFLILAVLRWQQREAVGVDMNQSVADHHCAVVIRKVKCEFAGSAAFKGDRDNSGCDLGLVNKCHKFQSLQILPYLRRTKNRG